MRSTGAFLYFRDLDHPAVRTVLRVGVSISAFLPAHPPVWVHHGSSSVIHLLPGGLHIIGSVYPKTTDCLLDLNLISGLSYPC